MGAVTNLQVLTTIEGDSSAQVGTDFEQPGEEWLDVGSWADAIICVQIKSAVTTSMDSLSLSIRTLTEKGDPTLTTDSTGPGLATEVWNINPLASGTVSKKVIYLGQGNTTPIERWLMWMVNVIGTSGPWRLTFQVTVTLKCAA